MKASRPLWWTFLAFLGPMMLSNILQALSGTVNNIYLGQMIGTHAVAAVSSFFPVLFLFISFLIGISGGATVLIGQAYGAKEPERLKAVAGTAIAAVLAAGLFIAVAGSLMLDPLLRALGTPADIVPETTAYARAMFVALPALFVFLLYMGMLRGVGDAVTPMYGLALSTGIGLVLTPALIQGWGGLPRLGAASGAYAAILSFPVALVWLSWTLRRRNHPMAPDRALFAHLSIDPALLRLVLRLGIPTALQMVTMALAEVAVLFLVNRYGSEATAAYGAVTQVMSYVQFPAMSIAITASILSAQSIGAGRTDRLGAITRTGLAVNVVITGGLVLCALLLSHIILGLFLTSAASIAIAQSLVRIGLGSAVLFGCGAVLSAVMRASGDVWNPMGISIFTILAIEVPAAWWLSGRLGIIGIWWAYPVAFTAMLLLQGGYYWFLWRKRTIQRLV